MCKDCCKAQAVKQRERPKESKRCKWNPSHMQLISCKIQNRHFSVFNAKQISSVDNVYICKRVKFQLKIRCALGYTRPTKACPILRCSNQSVELEDFWPSTAQSKHRTGIPGAHGDDSPFGIPPSSTFPAHRHDLSPHRIYLPLHLFFFLCVFNWYPSPMNPPTPSVLNYKAGHKDRKSVV